MVVMSDMENKKELVDMLSKNADVVYKKIIVLLATSGGSAAYAIKFLQEDDKVFYGYLFSTIFILFAIGVFENFLRIKSIEKNIKELIDD